LGGQTPYADVRSSLGSVEGYPAETAEDIRCDFLVRAAHELRFIVAGRNVQHLGSAIHFF